MIKKSATKKTYEEIKNMIMNQELLPGQPLIEKDFAIKLNISRTPLRAAIHLLQEDGLVELIPNKGTYVRNFSKNDIIFCFELVEALEGMAAYLIAEKYKSGYLIQSDFNNLKKLAKKMDESLDAPNVYDWPRYDEEFHNELSKLCGNYYIENEHTKLKIQMKCVLWFFTPMYVDKNESNKEHHEIIKVILEKDPDKVRQVAQNHRSRVRSQLIKYLYDRTE